MTRLGAVLALGLALWVLVGFWVSVAAVAVCVLIDWYMVMWLRTRTKQP